MLFGAGKGIVTMRDAIKGTLAGGFLGALAGLGVCMWLIPGTLLFVGDTIVIGALVGGVAGFVWGDDFFDWLKQNWGWFT